MTSKAVVAGVPEADLRPERPDAFASYSRRDDAFVSGQLVPALVAAGHKIWLDREDIPATADWEERIAGGLAAATAVICVLSPEFAESTVCKREVAHSRVEPRDQSRAAGCRLYATKQQEHPAVARRGDPSRSDSFSLGRPWTD
jgi:hypothetical protein